MTTGCFDHNVRISRTGITHARGVTERQVTRCGVVYVRNGQYILGDMDQRPMGHRTHEDVDCMTCLVKSENNMLDLYDDGYHEE